MTSQKTFKRRVRARMAKTGESYTAARHTLHAKVTPAPAVEPPSSDVSVVRATGRAREAWNELLDAWGATERTHTEAARWLVETHGVAGWWAQNITVGYERARGLRTVHQQSSGFSIGVSKTVAVPMERLRAAFLDPDRRTAWLGDVAMTPRAGRGGSTIRFDWGDGSRVALDFVVRPTGRSTVTVTHGHLAGAEAAERMKAWWRERLATLARLLAE